MRTSYTRHRTIKKSDIAPQCDRCKRPIKIIARKGMPSVRVDPRPIWFIPKEGGVEVVNAQGRICRGEIATDGIKGYIAHRCR